MPEVQTGCPFATHVSLHGQSIEDQTSISTSGALTLQNGLPALTT